jgi:hypothetical protein
MPQTTELVQRVDSAIAACVPAAVRSSPTVWRVPSDDPARAGVRIVRLDDDWLLLETPLPSALPGDSLWCDLLQNASVSGPAKTALADDQRRRVAQAEIPLDDEVDLALRIDQACEGVAQLIPASHASRPHIGRESAPRARVAGDQASPLDPAHLLTTAGWSFVEREPGFLVELPVPGQFCQAVVRLDAGGGVRVTVDVVAPHTLSPVSREALGALLLSTSRVCRMVRGAARDEASVGAVAFEVHVASRPTAAELGHALAALSIACREAAREAAVLVDERVAASYLEVRGLGSSIARSS